MEADSLFMLKVTNWQLANIPVAEGQERRHPCSTDSKSSSSNAAQTFRNVSAMKGPPFSHQAFSCTGETGSLRASQPTCRCHILREEGQNQVPPSTVRRIPWSSMLLGPSHETCLRPSEFSVFSCKRLRFQRLPLRVQTPQSFFFWH